jgi:hypothetical protein
MLHRTHQAQKQKLTLKNPEGAGQLIATEEILGTVAEARIGIKSETLREAVAEIKTKNENTNQKIDVTIPIAMNHQQTLESIAAEVVLERRDRGEILPAPMITSAKRSRVNKRNHILPQNQDPHRITKRNTRKKRKRVKTNVIDLKTINCRILNPNLDLLSLKIKFSILFVKKIH